MSSLLMSASAQACHLPSVANAVSSSEEVSCSELRIWMSFSLALVSAGVCVPPRATGAEPPDEDELEQAVAVRAPSASTKPAAVVREARRDIRMVRGPPLPSSVRSLKSSALYTADFVLEAAYRQVAAEPLQQRDLKFSLGISPPHFLLVALTHRGLWHLLQIGPTLRELPFRDQAGEVVAQLG